MDIALGLAAAALLIALNALFVAAEFALVAVERSRLERLRDEGNRRARVALGLLERLSFNLSGAQLGITVTSLVLGFVAEPTIARALRPVLDALPFLPPGSTFGVSIVLALALATGTQMVIGELIPKGWAISRPIELALAIAWPMRVYGAAFGPIILFLNGAANRTLRLVRIEPREELSAVRSMEELDLLIRSSAHEGTLDPEAMTLLTRTIRFREKHASDALLPRSSVVTLHERDTVADLARLAVETGHSRFPVTRASVHDIAGVVHAKDVFRVPVSKRSTTHVTELMKDVPIVPEPRDLGSLLVEMRAGGDQLAVVVDEYGSTSGILTLEDILEEIVGEIEDEYDTAETLAAPGNIPGTWTLDGRLHRDEVQEITGFEMPEGNYRTLAGFMLSLLERIPEPGDRMTHDGWELEVLQLDRLRIALVRITAPPPEDTEEDGR